VLVEVEALGVPSYSTAARVVTGHDRSEWFPWAIVGSDSLLDVAEAAGFHPPTKWEAGAAGSPPYTQIDPKS